MLPCIATDVSGCAQQADSRKVDLGLGNFVDVVGQSVERNVDHNFHHLGVAIARTLHRLNIGIGYVSALLRNFCGKTYIRIGFGVGRSTVAVRRDFSVVQLGYVFAEIGMGMGR
jgi:hypothetical protein